MHVSWLYLCEFCTKASHERIPSIGDAARFDEYGDAGRLIEAGMVAHAVFTMFSSLCAFECISSKLCESQLFLPKKLVMYSCLFTSSFLETFEASLDCSFLAGPLFFFFLQSLHLLEASF